MRPKPYNFSYMLMNIVTSDDGDEAGAHLRNNGRWFVIYYAEMHNVSEIRFVGTQHHLFPSPCGRIRLSQPVVYIKFIKLDQEI